MNDLKRLKNDSIKFLGLILITPLLILNESFLLNEKSKSGLVIFKYNYSSSLSSIFIY